ncbi:MAG TPA: flagellar basal-body rod protein FlgG [Syntrophomonadaceae bacterium]|nr:flagellar basal-body rod protein FlgG [Syntrophomonadaceae bacterium]
MIRALYTASTGMLGQQMAIDTLANNMANVNTPGFKQQRLEFQDLLYQTIKRPTVNDTTNEPLGLVVGMGVKQAATNTLFTQGPLNQTDNSLDVAIDGPGFFKIEAPGYDDPIYTRDGSFKIDAAGQLVTSDGNKVVGVDALGEGAYDVEIAKDGMVTYKIPGSDTAQEAGQIELAKFMNPAGMEKLGGNLYKATPSSGDPVDWDSSSDSATTLQPGYLEGSNVQVVQEMVNLITAQRAYEFNSKVIQSSDELLQTATNLRK